MARTKSEDDFLDSGTELEHIGRLHVVLGETTDSKTVSMAFSTRGLGGLKFPDDRPLVQSDTSPAL